jgi:hypothetical protein
MRVSGVLVMAGCVQLRKGRKSTHPSFFEVGKRGAYG